MKEIKLYTINNCPFCEEMKGLLKEAKIPFTELNLSIKENEDSFDKLSKITKSEMVPLIVIGKDLLVPNKSFKTIVEGFGYVKKLIS